MSSRTLYDEDILLWSEEQAALIRELGNRRFARSNELDLENVAEEIESVGRSELASVESQLQNILLHLIKLSAEPRSESVRHRPVEVLSFHADMRRRYAPSMQQRIDLDQLWRIARKLAILGAPDGMDLGERLPISAPLDLGELLGHELDVDALIGQIARSDFDLNVPRL